MCGIAGVVGEVPNMKSLLKKMSQVQLHRGPDNMGSWISWVVDSEIGMIHNRLAVKQIKGVSEQPYMRIPDLFWFAMVIYIIMSN